MPASVFWMKQGDTGNPIRAILRDGDGAINLTNATVRFTMRALGSSSLKVNRQTATTVSASAGSVRYNWAAADIDTPGVYECEWEITFQDGTILTVPDTGYDRVEIADDLA